MRRAFISLITFVTTVSAWCFSKLYPQYIREITATGDGEWLAVTKNESQDKVFTAGYTTAVGLFSGLPQGKYPFAGGYDHRTTLNVWTKIYTLQGTNNQFDAVTIKNDETVLALAGSSVDKMTLFVYLVDPETGSQLYPYFTLGLDFPGTLLNDQSMCFTAGSRLYITAEFYRGAAAGDKTQDVIQFATVSFSPLGVIKLWQKYSRQGIDGGSSANLINVLPLAADGSERVLMGSGVYIPGSGFVLALMLISPVDGSISQINLKYDTSGSYFIDETKYHYFAKTVTVANGLFAVTRSAKEDERGSQTYYCFLKFTDTTFTTLDVSIASNNQCYRQLPVAGYSNSQIILDIYKPPTTANLHFVSQDVANQRLIAGRVSTPYDSCTFSMTEGYNAKAAVFDATFGLEGIGNGHNQRFAFIVGGTSSFLDYGLPITEPNLMPYLTSVLPSQTCSNFAHIGLYGTSNVVGAGQTQSTIHELVILAQLSTTFQITQPFIDSTKALTTNNMYITRNVDYALTKRCNLCRSYKAVTATPGSFPNQIMYLQSLNSPITCSFIPNVATHPTCTVPDLWSYSIDESALGQSYDLFAINAATNQITMVLKDTAFVEGDYLITVVGITPSLLTQSFQFYFSVVPGSTVPTCTTTTTCATSILTVISTPSFTNQIHTVGSMFNLPGPVFTVVSPMCTALDVTSTMSVLPATLGQSTAFITFDPVTSTLTFNSLNNIDAGAYTVTIVGTVADLHKSQTSTSFPLTVIPSCAMSNDVIAVAATSQNNILYSVGTAASTTVLQPFTQSSLFCSINDIAYSITVTADQGQSTTFVSLTTMTLAYFTPDSFGIYSVVLTGSLTNALSTVTATTSFLLTITAAQSQCLAGQTMVTTKTLPDIFYTVGTTLSEPVFIQDNVDNTCVPEWQYSLRPQSGKLPSFVSFDAIRRQINIYSLDPKPQTIAMFLEVSRRDGIIAVVPFELKIVLPPNDPPTLQGQFEPFYLVNNMTSDTVQLGPIYSPDNRECTIKFLSQTNKISYNISSGLMTIQRDNLTEGDYYVQIILSDNFKLNPGLTYYTILVSKAAQIENSSDQNKTIVSSTASNYTDPTLDLMWVSNRGLMKIYFSEKITATNDTINATVLDIQLIQGGNQNKTYFAFSWNVTSFQSTQLEIQLIFEHPMYISSEGPRRADQINVTCINLEFFRSNKTNMTIRNSVQTTLPPQITWDIELFTQIMSIVSKTVTISNFFIALLLKLSLGLIWGTGNVFQIIQCMTLFNLYTPGNVIEFFQWVDDMANFTLIPVDWILSSVFGEDILVEIKQIQELGMFFIGIVTLSGYLVLYCLLAVCARCTERFDPCVTRLKHTLFWNAILRYIIEGYSTLSLLSLEQVIQLEWTDSMSKGKTVIAIITLLVLLFAPISMTIYFSNHLAQFWDSSYQNKFKDIIDLYNPKTASHANHISIFCYRRLALAVLIVFAKNYPALQFICMHLSCISVLIAFGYSNVFALPRDRQLEYFNEVCIVVALSHFMCFSDFVPNPETRSQVGSSLIRLVTVNFFANASVTSYYIWIPITWRVRRCKKIRDRRKKVKHAAELRKQFLLDRLEKQRPTIVIPFAELRIINRHSSKNSEEVSLRSDPQINLDQYQQEFERVQRQPQQLVLPLSYQKEQEFEGLQQEQLLSFSHDDKEAQCEKSKIATPDSRSIIIAEEEKFQMQSEIDDSIGREMKEIFEFERRLAIHREARQRIADLEYTRWRARTSEVDQSLSNEDADPGFTNLQRK